jgi:hypothetical protein
MTFQEERQLLRDVAGNYSLDVLKVTAECSGGKGGLGYMSAITFVQTMDRVDHLRDSVAITQAETATALRLCSVSPS